MKFVSLLVANLFRRHRKSESFRASIYHLQICWKTVTMILISNKGVARGHFIQEGFEDAKVGNKNHGVLTHHGNTANRPCQVET